MNNKLTRFLFAAFALLIASGNHANAQLVQVSGFIYQRDTAIAIPYVTIINKKNNTGAISDYSGFYTLVLAPGDTVEVNAIGFEKRKFTLPAVVTGDSYTYNVYLNRTSYDLAGVDIGFNLERFKKEFESMPLVERSPMVMGDPNIYRNYVAPKENFGVTIKGPFTALYNKFSPRAREMEKLQQLLENDNKEMIANIRLNRDLIHEITGIEDEKIDGFLSYCNMSSEFIANATKYDLMVAIDRCYTNYTKNKVTPKDSIPPGRQ